MLLENVRIVLQIGIFRNRYFQLNSMYHLLPGKELHSFMLMVIFISRTFSREKKKKCISLHVGSQRIPVVCVCMYLPFKQRNSYQLKLSVLLSCKKELQSFPGKVSKDSGGKKSRRMLNASLCMNASQIILLQRQKFSQGIS